MAEVEPRTAISEPQMTVHETQMDEDPKTAVTRTEAAKTSCAANDEIHSLADINIALLKIIYRPALHPIFDPIENNANVKREYVCLVFTASSFPSLLD